MPKKPSKNKENKKEEKPPTEEEPNEENEAEPESEPETHEPTEEEKQREIELKLEYPQSIDDIVLDFELEAPSAKIQKYLLIRKQRYIDAHNKFKENDKKINIECNEEISIAANNVRYQIKASNKILSDLLSIFKNDEKLSSIKEIEVDQCWKLIEKEFSEREILFNNFTATSNKIESVRRSAIQSEIQNLFMSCIDTALLPPNKIEKSLQPKIMAMNELITKKTKFYEEFVMRLRENDAKLTEEHEDQYKDGKLRWNQLQRAKNKENQPELNPILEALKNPQPENTEIETEKKTEKTENDNIPNVADEKS